jgi:hypothetical protein
MIAEERRVEVRVKQDLECRNHPREYPRSDGQYSSLASRSLYSMYVFKFHNSNTILALYSLLLRRSFLVGSVI